MENSDIMQRSCSLLAEVLLSVYYLTKVVVYLRSCMPAKRYLDEFNAIDHDIYGVIHELFT
jgi:hypothetical protein